MGYWSSLIISRLNFSLDNLEVVSPYYEHFIRCLELSYSTSGGELQFQVQKLPIDFPQHSDYDRVKELVSQQEMYV